MSLLHELKEANKYKKYPFFPPALKSMIYLYVDKCHSNISWPNLPTFEILQLIIIQAKEIARNASKNFRGGKKAVFDNVEVDKACVTQTWEVKRGRELDSIVESENHTPAKRRYTPFKDMFGVQVYGFPHSTCGNDSININFDGLKTVTTTQEQNISEHSDD